MWWIVIISARLYRSSDHILSKNLHAGHERTSVFLESNFNVSSSETVQYELLECQQNNGKLPLAADLDLCHCKALLFIRISMSLCTTKRLYTM